MNILNFYFSICKKEKKGKKKHTIFLKIHFEVVTLCSVMSMYVCSVVAVREFKFESIMTARLDLISCKAVGLL